MDNDDNDNDDDGWNIDGQMNLFADNGEITLDEMIDSLANKGIERFSVYNFVERTIGQAVQVIQCDRSIESEQQKAENRRRKSILKTSSMVTANGGDMNKEVLSLKKVTFDVEKFAADECDDVTERNEARARLAVRLGARPPRNRFVNYKVLKEELNMKKHSEAEFDKLFALKALKKLSMRKKKVKGKKLRKK